MLLLPLRFAHRDVAPGPLLARYPALILVAGAHILLGWVLWALGAVPRPDAEPRPVMVALVTPERPEPDPPQPPQPLPRVPSPARPELAPLLPPPLPAPESPVAITVHAPPPPPMESATAPMVAASPSPAAPPPPPARRQLDHTAVRYLTEPPAELPRASRRAGESGTVWLRVVVDVNGLPAAVLLHRSSGHGRLDEQALWAMRQARFRPHTEGGRAIEVEVIAPIEYPAE